MYIPPKQVGFVPPFCCKYTYKNLDKKQLFEKSPLGDGFASFFNGLAGLDGIFLSFSLFHFFTFDICEKKLRRRQERRRGGNYGNNYNYLI